MSSSITKHTAAVIQLPSILVRERRDLPSISAVYYIVEDATVLYVGQTKNLRDRFVSHHRLAMMHETNHRIYWDASVKTMQARLQKERQAIVALRPLWNNAKVAPQTELVSKIVNVSVPEPTHEQMWQEWQDVQPKPLPRNAPTLLMRYLIQYMLCWLGQKAIPIISGLFTFAVSVFVMVSIWMLYVSAQLNNAPSAILYGEMCIIGLLIIIGRRIERLLKPKTEPVRKIRPFNEYFDDVCHIIGIK